jgi:hypothetical protein
MLREIIKARKKKRYERRILMALVPLLQGSELIDCAIANGSQGIAVAAERCGYGDHLKGFEQALQIAGQTLGLEIKNFNELIQPKKIDQELGVDIAPESPTQF